MYQQSKGPMTESTAVRVQTNMGEDNRDRDNVPTGKQVTCPSCNADAYAIVPKHTTIVDGDETADGKVQVNCRNCENRFLVYYQNCT